MLSLVFVTGSAPSKWIRRYQEATGDSVEAIDAADPWAVLIDAPSSPPTVALLRLPDPRLDAASEDFHMVRLYEEAPGVAVPKDSVYAEVGEQVAESDLADEYVNLPFSHRPDVDALREALQVVAANVGVAYGPLPLLKHLSKKQVVPLEVAGPSVAPTPIALVWRKDDDCDAIQDFVGITKGRSVRSSRANAAQKSHKSHKKRKKGKKGKAIQPRGRGRRRGRN
ncbi:LysR family transcriptional regulator [Corynebacterium sp. NML 120412]|uniref:LysR family transcriptional regulator n=1 Tax=Corynebacterium sp. NML 120412 TaxID=2029401 RepID=UPI000BAA91B0|nr:LysR family transcriptional regulator [Corynebacterium sp. NML 120412]PAT15001.1 LysR family transcriptional regulator [Corynebacterium sp. NML 120412]